MALQLDTRPQSYAQQQNSRYSNKNSMYLNIKDRFNSIISNVTPLKQTGIRSSIIQACNEFLRKFPNIQKFEDFDLVETINIPMSDILIDVTIQRLLNIAWVCAIVSNFRDVQAMPIQVYPVHDTDVPYTATGPRGLFASWDGQHTLAVLYVVAVLILKLDPKDVMVPVAIYKVKKKSEIRENFVKGNGPEGKKLLDAVDYYMQKIYGVRVDGNTNPMWVEAEIKQQYLEQADLFVTADKFGDTFMPGAISRLQEIDNYSSDIIRKFALYTTTFPQPRPVASQEIEIMCAWFDMAKRGGIDYNDEQVINLGNHLHTLFGADFHESSTFWDVVRRAYTNWHKKYWDGFLGAPSHIKFSKNWKNGGTFLWFQLKKTWEPSLVPNLTINGAFVPDNKDLY